MTKFLGRTTKIFSETSSILNFEKNHNVQKLDRRQYSTINLQNNNWIKRKSVMFNPQNVKYSSEVTLVTSVSFYFFFICSSCFKEQESKD